MRLNTAIIGVLRRARYRQAITIEQVAERAGLAPVTVSKLLSGDGGHVGSLAAVARALGVEQAMAEAVAACEDGIRR